MAGTADKYLTQNLIPNSYHCVQIYYILNYCNKLLTHDSFSEVLLSPEQVL